MQKTVVVSSRCTPYAAFGQIRQIRQSRHNRYRQFGDYNMRGEASERAGSVSDGND